MNPCVSAAQELNVRIEAQQRNLQNALRQGFCAPGARMCCSSWIFETKANKQ